MEKKLESTEEASQKKTDKKTARLGELLLNTLLKTDCMGFEISEESRLAKIKDLIEAAEAPINYVGSNKNDTRTIGYTPLMLALLQDDDKIVAYLLNHPKIDCNTKSRRHSYFEMTALEVGVICRSLSTHRVRKKMGNPRNLPIDRVAKKIRYHQNGEICWAGIITGAIIFSLGFLVGKHWSAHNLLDSDSSSADTPSANEIIYPLESKFIKPERADPFLDAEFLEELEALREELDRMEASYQRST